PVSRAEGARRRAPARAPRRHSAGGCLRPRRQRGHLPARSRRQRRRALPRPAARGMAARRTRRVHHVQRPVRPPAPPRREPRVVTLPLLLLHEGIADARMWEANDFGARRVLAPDLRGYGSRPLEPGPYSDVDDLVELLDDEGVERAALVGCSYGGRVALELDRKSTRLNSSHDQISYAVFCLKKK